MNGFVIVPLPAEYAAAAHELECESLSTAWSLRQIAECACANAKSGYLCALSGGGLAGVISFGVAFDECEIYNLAVNPGFRRRGAARALLGAALENARLRGAKKAFLEVACGNAAALALYKSEGFGENGRRRGFYHGEDAVLMEKKL